MSGSVPDTGARVASPSIIQEATRVCLKGFISICEEVEVTPTAVLAVKELSDSLARFRIWAGNIGAWHGVHDPKSADAKLRSAPEVADRICELLEELADTIDDIHEIASGHREDASVSAADEAADVPSDESKTEVCLLVAIPLENFHLRSCLAGHHRATQQVYDI